MRDPSGEARPACADELDTRGVNPIARRALWLTAWLIAVILAGLGLHLLAMLVPGEDLTLVRDLAGDRDSTLTTLAHGASWLGRSAVLVPAGILIGLGAIALGRPLRGIAVPVAVLGAIVIQNADKAIVARPRPPVHQLEHVSSTSFPSGHATESTAFFLVLAAMFYASGASLWARRLVVATTIVVIAAVALSRVYLGVHYPTDVVAGMLLGAAWATITAATLIASGHSHVRS
jgi:undecaprenyl-diphosphatase